MTVRDGGVITVASVGDLVSLHDWNRSLPTQVWIRKAEVRRDQHDAARLLQDFFQRRETPTEKQS
jgi:hypothetical protein